MLHGMAFNGSIQAQVLNMLQSAPFDFHLTGSRFFGTNTEKSDYDFFCEDNVAVRAFLRKNGFICDNEGYPYFDSNTIMVYKHVKAQIDVAIVRNSKAKLAVQGALLRNNLGVLLRNKPMATMLWNFSYEMYLKNL